MPDYNIYIRTINGDGDTSKTNPNKAEKSETSVDEESEEEKEMNFLALIKQGSQLIGNAKSAVVGAIKAAAPVIAVVAAAKIADKAITLIEPFVTQASGDYKFNTEYNNMKTALNVVSHPVSSTIGYFRFQQMVDITNQRNEQSKILLGDTALGSAEGENV